MASRLLHLCTNLISSLNPRTLFLGTYYYIQIRVHEIIDGGVSLHKTLSLPPSNYSILSILLAKFVRRPPPNLVLISSEFGREMAALRVFIVFYVN